MFIVSSYPIAVALCFVTMICWGSWVNTQKLAGRQWNSQLFYWDYVIGILLFALLLGFTAGSIGDEGRSFVDDLKQANSGALLSTFVGGVVCNLSNLLLVAATEIAGIAIAFPVGVGLALVLGVIFNYVAAPEGDAMMLFAGVGLVVAAIVIQSIASSKMSRSQGKSSVKGLVVAIVSGCIMATFYRFVAASMSLNFTDPEAGLMTPYSALFVFAVGVLISNFVFNTYFMRRPVSGEPVSYKDYLTKGSVSLHLIGIAGGVIWCLGMACSIIAAEKAGPAISYGLGQGATLIAAVWGVFVWKEFRGAGRVVNALLTGMFVSFLTGLLMIVYAGMN